MIAAVLHGPRDLRVEQIAEPEPAPGAVKLRVAHNGLCGPDLHAYYQDGPFLGRPQVMGHELCGTVAELVEGVTDLTLGPAPRSSRPDGKYVPGSSCCWLEGDDVTEF